jgi:hypothetical protein
VVFALLPPVDFIVAFFNHELELMALLKFLQSELLPPEVACRPSQFELGSYRIPVSHLGPASHQEHLLSELPHYQQLTSVL